MDENPYRSPEGLDEQEQPVELRQAQHPPYVIPEWVFVVIVIIAIMGTLVALFAPTIN